MELFKATPLLPAVVSNVIIRLYPVIGPGGAGIKIAPITGIAKAEESPDSLLVRAAARIEKAKLLLGKGAADEAGEEAWRAVIDAINAAATALWGVAAKSHKATSYLEGKIAEYIERVWGRRAADTFRSAYGSAESLHDNFYDPRFDAKTVEANIRQAERVVLIITNLIRQIQRQEPLHYYMKAIANPYFLITWLLADILEDITRSRGDPHSTGKSKEGEGNQVKRTV